MPAFNFFKIYTQQHAHLSTLLISKGLALVDNHNVVDNGTTFHYELYFTEAPAKRPVKWIKELKKQFTVGDFRTESYSAAVLISFRSHVYAISFGASHFLVSRFADLEFGINIASRLLKSYKSKNSREFGGTRVKSIETFLTTDDVSFEAGEAVNYIKGVPHNTTKWGNNFSCGQSVQLRKSTLSIKDIHKVCAQLERALLLKVKNAIPQAISIKDLVKCQALNQKLISDMKNGYYIVDIAPQQLSGVAFLFADQYDFVCSMGGKSVQIDETLSSVELRTLVDQHFRGDYQRLLDANVAAQEDGVTIYTKPFINFVDYVDTQDNYYLEDGKWYRFDKNYLSNVRNEVDKIPLDFSTEMLTFDESSYNTWLNNQPSAQKHYRERYLNGLLETKFGYANQDRSFVVFESATVEVSDLFKGGTTYIVKIGTPQKLNYAIDQAKASVHVLERERFQILINGSKQKVTKVCLWLFIERQKPITRISEINSLIFLMKLANWRKFALRSGLQTEVRVSYKQ